MVILRRLEMEARVDVHLVLISLSLYYRCSASHVVVLRVSSP